MVARDARTVLALRVRRMAAVGVACLSFVHCASSGSSSGDPRDLSSAGSRADDFQFIGSFADVRAVAVSRRYVFSATPSGIGIYDRLFNAWQTPLSRDNGFVGDQITAFAADPAEDAIWFGVPGALMSYRPQVEQLQRTLIVGVPDIIAFERAPTGDVLVRASGSWTRVSRSGLASPMIGVPSASAIVLPRTLSDVYAQFPQLRSQQSMLFRAQRADRGLRTYPVLSGATTPERVSEVWLGTAGDGLYKVDPTFQQATPLRFGPLESAVGALALAADGVWMAGRGTSVTRAGISYASNDLQRWRWIDGTIATPMLGVRAQVMAVRGPRAWIGTDRGLVRVQLDAAESTRAWSTLDGLPDDRVYAIAATDSGAWAGTARGLVWISDSASTRTLGVSNALLAGTAVYALQLIGDTRWMGTSAGLVSMPASAATSRGSVATLARPAGTDPALRRPVTALAWSDSVLLAATDDGVLQLALRGSAPVDRIAAFEGRPVGAVSRLQMDDRTIWLVGSEGVRMLSRRSGGVQQLRVPADLPAAVTDLVASREWIWIGTTAGIVRLRRTGDGGVR